MRIIPAIDLLDGKCVRLTQGDYNQKKIYRDDPLDVAKEFEDAGIQYLHLVDLQGAKEKQLIHTDVLEDICSKTRLKVDFGGGLYTHEEVKRAFNCGAKQVTIGSAAVKNPSLFKSWLNIYGSEKIILGADFKDQKIAISGWQEKSDMEAETFIEKYQKLGVEYAICTDISKDGMLAGSSNEFYQSILQKMKIKLIASGGVSSIEDLLALKEIGCEGAIIGKALYEGRISLKQIKDLC